MSEEQPCKKHEWKELSSMVSSNQCCTLNVRARLALRSPYMWGKIAGSSCTIGKNYPLWWADYNGVSSPAAGVEALFEGTGLDTLAIMTATPRIAVTRVASVSFVFCLAGAGLASLPVVRRLEQAGHSPVLRCWQRLRCPLRQELLLTACAPGLGRLSARRGVVGIFARSLDMTWQSLRGGESPELSTAPKLGWVRVPASVSKRGNAQLWLMEAEGRAHAGKRLSKAGPAGRGARTGGLPRAHTPHSSRSRAALHPCGPKPF